MSDRFRYQLWIENNEWGYKCIDPTPRNADGLTPQQVEQVQLMVWAIEDENPAIDDGTCIARTIFPATFAEPEKEQVELSEEQVEVLRAVAACGERIVGKPLRKAFPEAFEGERWELIRWGIPNTGEWYMGSKGTQPYQATEDHPLGERWILRKVNSNE